LAGARAKATWMKRAAVFVFFILLLVGLAGGLGYFQFVIKPEMIKGFITKAVPPPTTVTAENAKTENWVAKIPAIGTFRSIQGIDVASEVGGLVRSLQVDSGQQVKAGDPLIQLDDSIEQADLASNSALLKNADKALDRASKLSARGNATEAAVDAALSARDAAAAAVDRSKAVIAQKSIKAPFAGRLGLRRVDIGQYVSPGLGLVTLQQMDPINVDFPVPEQYVAVIRIGQDLEIRVDAYPNETFAGKVKSIDARINADTRNVLIRGEVPNADARVLPGMYAQVNVIAGAASAFVTVPRTAITYSLYGDTAFVVKPATGSNGSASPPTGGAQAATPQTPPPDASTPALIAERRFVRVGETRGERVAVLEGIAADEEVVTSGQIKLQPNARIRVDNTDALKAPAERPKE
jgi:membrane fusion protein (multidrug efflux system)